MITVKQLNQLRYLKLEITAEKERLESVTALLETHAMRYDAVRVQTSGEDDTLGRLASEIVYLKQLIADNMKRAICELLRLEEFIRSIEDSDLRIIFKERYMKCKSWRSISLLLGDGDEQLPRRRHDRYLDKYNKEHA